MSEYTGCNGCACVDRNADEQTCVECKHTYKDKFKRRTNADRIRSMTDAEILNFVYDVSTNCAEITTCDKPCKECNKTDDECKNGFRAWLMKEVEE